MYKVASGDLKSSPLLKYIAETGKPILLSTGGGEMEDVERAYDTITNINPNLAILQCTAAYPCEPDEMNLNVISTFREKFKDIVIGLSDHQSGISMALVAFTLGARIVEKHFTLRRADGGVDSAFSLEPEEMKQLVIETERAWQSLGQVKYGSTKAEKGSLTFRRSLYIAEDMKKGDVLNEQNLRIVRPGLGLEPKYYDILLGRKVSRDVKKGTALSTSALRLVETPV